MSLQYGYSSALNTAVYNLAQSGVFVAAAAGNWNMDACSISPASAYGAYTTGATDSADARSIWGGGQASNYGSCVNGNAPGTNIKSGTLNSGTTTMSGTSRPHRTWLGRPPSYKATYGDHSWITIRDWINSSSTVGVISGLPSGTANRLLSRPACSTSGHSREGRRHRRPSLARVARTPYPTTTVTATRARNRLVYSSGYTTFSM